MAKLNDEAKAYVPKSTKNIADLESVPVDIELEERTYTTTKDGKETEFSVKVVVVNNEEYRVPASVLKQLKVHLEQNPKLKNIKVIRHGTSINDTTYTVVPMG